MRKILPYVSAAGAVMVLCGAVLQITRLTFAPYLYLVGAVMFAAVQAVCGYDGDSIVIRRLRRQQLIGAVLMVAAGVLMLTMHHNEWIACLTVSAILELYTVFRISHEEEKG